MSIQENIISVSSVRTIVASVTAGLAGTLVYHFFKKRILDSADGDGFQNRPKHNFCHVEIPQETVAYLIGKDGSSIQDIEQQTGVSISFIDPGGPCKLCVLKSINDQAIQEARKLILKSVEEFNQLETSEICVSQKVIDYLTANDNRKLNAIMAASKARTHIYRVEDKPRSLLVRGLHHQIEAVRSLLKEIVIEEEINIKKKSASVPQEITYSSLSSTKPLNRSESRPDTSVDGQAGYERLVATSSDGYCEVMVSAIVNPTKFFVQKAGPVSSELDRLNDEMTVFFTDESNRQPFSAGPDAEIGKLVSVYATDDKQWYRAMITAKPTAEETVAVQFLDFGDVIIAPFSNIDRLPSQFMKLKFQAIECRLANITPLGGKEWTDDVGEAFKSLTYCTLWKIIMAKIESYSQLESGALVPCVKLIDTNTDKDVDIAAELISRGLGDYFPN